MAVEKTRERSQQAWAESLLLHFFSESILPMGNDGGSVPVRCEQVKLKKKEKPIDSTEKDRLKYLTCAISHESLVGKQTVCDRLGNLFDKHSVMKCMVEKNLPPAFSHLRSLKDLINVQFTKNEEYQDNKEAQLGNVESFVSPFACPLTTRPVNGKYKYHISFFGIHNILTF